MAEHLVEDPGVGRHHLVRVAGRADVRPFVQADRDPLLLEPGDALQVLLVVLVLRPDLRRGLAHPLDERVLDGDLLALLQVEPLVAGGVEVLAQEIDAVQAVGQQAAAPVRGRQVVRHDLAVETPSLLGAGHRVGHRAGGDQLDRRIHPPHRLGEQVVLQHELRERHETQLPVAPGLVTHAPELDVVRLGMAIGGAQAPHRGGGGSVRVLDELRGGPRVAEARVDGHVGLDVQQPAQGHELVGADVVGLNRVPDRVHDGRTPVGIADGVAPLVAGDEVAAREAVDAGLQLPERGHDLRPGSPARCSPASAKPHPRGSCPFRSRRSPGVRRRCRPPPRTAADASDSRSRACR